MMEKQMKTASKKPLVSPEIELIPVPATDVITTSGPYDDPPYSD